MWYGQQICSKITEIRQCDCIFKTHICNQRSFTGLLHSHASLYFKLNDIICQILSRLVFLPISYDKYILLGKIFICSFVFFNPTVLIITYSDIFCSSYMNNFDKLSCRDLLYFMNRFGHPSIRRLSISIFDKFHFCCG
jgi:hypothetical protein